MTLARQLIDTLVPEGDAGVLLDRSGATTDLVTRHALF
jgi:hypothetical protein